MHRGYIKLWRKIQDNRFWLSEPFTRGQAWIDLIMLANHKPNFFYVRDHKISLERGQTGYSQNSLSLRWKWSRSKVKKFLNDLEKEQQIKQQISKSFTILTIVEYDLYQKKEQQVVQQESNSATREKQQEDINKNEKNVNNVKNEKNNTLAQNRFDHFWSSYPKKKSKGDAKKAWIVLNPDQPLFDIIILGLDSAKQSHDWIKENGKFIPYPATWIRAEGWNDEYAKPKPTTGSKLTDKNLEMLGEWVNEKN